MGIHTNAALTIKQRKEVKRLHEQEGLSIRKLAARFGVNNSCIQRWVGRDSPLDLSTAPKKKPSGLSKQQKEAIIHYRSENPKAGARTITWALSEEYGPMSHATISRFLRSQGLTRLRPKKPKEIKPLKVGRHRLQMDIQQLPAIRGGKSFEYKISIIHMATRMKYSEIHDRVTAQTVAKAVKNALAHMPPFFLIWTDNAWEFTMKYTKWKDTRKTALDKLLDEWGFIHALIPKGKPWRNGIVERVHRTDNENLFHAIRFSSSEDRKYQLWLWDRQYNFNRPHQGLGGKTPADKFIEMFPIHANARMLMS